MKIFYNLLLRLRINLFKLFHGGSFSSISSLRSDSDNGLYPPYIEYINANPKKFSTFKSHPVYKDVLEHLSYEDGLNYYNIIFKDNPQLLDPSLGLACNDLIGSPSTYIYPIIGCCSPTTLRYIKVTSDILKLFGKDTPKSIAEIGVGYGGQCLILDRALKPESFFLFDLQPVLNLTSKYLDSFILNSYYSTYTLNRFNNKMLFDLIISNYAFSELPKEVQFSYINKIILKSSRGYLTMTSGNCDSANINKFSSKELLEIIPNSSIISEDPLTSQYNYIIVWGLDR